MNDKKAPRGNLLSFGDWSVSLKLMAGFGAVILCIIILVAVVYSTLNKQEKIQSQIIEQRMPTNLAGRDLANGINGSLATLRGYMILGKDDFKRQRAEYWRDIDANLALLTTKSKGTSSSSYLTRLEEMKQLMVEFRAAQDKVESIAKTEDEQPGLKILQKEVTPLASDIIRNITQLIDEEKLQPATAARKDLLANLADSRGSFAISISAIRTFLLSGDKLWSDQFDQYWQKNAAALQKLNNQSQLFTVNQLREFNQYKDNVQMFSTIPQRIFDIRNSNRWNEALFLLGSEAAPRAAKLQALLNELVKEQNELINKEAEDLQANSASIKVISLLATLITILIAGFIAWFITRKITSSLRQAISLADAIAAGNIYNTVEQTSADETGQLLSAIYTMQSSLQENAVINNDYSAQIEAINKAQAVIEFDLDGIVQKANTNFLTTLGYSLEEVQGKHHSLFVDPSFKTSDEYQAFWRTLKSGQYQAGEYKRVRKNGDHVWIQASYNPIVDLDGKPFKVVKYATDITAQKLQEVENRKIANLSSALHLCNANVMLADMDLNICYMNNGMEAMLRGNQAQIRQELTDFNVDTLIGTCVDIFHKKAQHQRGIVSSLEKSKAFRITVAGLTFRLTISPWLDPDGKRLGTVVEWYDLTQELAEQEAERAEANANARIKQALDNVSTNTMIADASNKIIYMNAAIDNMMRTAEKDIQAALPNFSAAALLGENMDSFHKNPAHQQAIINRLESTYAAEIEIGVRTFKLIANPITGTKGERIGSVVEWNDRTEEVAIEKEIANLISAAGEGDLTCRIEESGKTGFFLNLAGGLNQLVSIAEGVINETVTMLDAMAHGNLTKRIESDYQGAFNKLKMDANTTVEKLTEVINRISNASASVASGAEEIAQGNTDLSQRTEEQASSLEETASSMEEMTSTVRQNADNAKVANNLASDATVKAQKGGDVVKRAVNSMAEINQSSKKIADIIGVIDEIAFQTNLLALNAAVEAARAGEQGRGFAVVAGEVRNLAQRSAAAAKEIKDLIRDSVAKVQDGSQLVNESGATLNEIVEAISRVTTMIADIADASNEQSEGIEQVNKAVTQMDEMTQQNAALVEQASAAGEAMADQARGMRQILGFFTTDTNAAVPSSQLVVAAPAKTPKSAGNNMKPAAAPAKKAESVDFTDDDDEWEEF